MIITMKIIMAKDNGTTLMAILIMAKAQIMVVEAVEITLILILLAVAVEITLILIQMAIMSIHITLIMT